LYGSPCELSALLFYSECEIGGIDLVFVLDSSFSIRRLWNEIRQFAVQVASVLHIGLDQSLVGVIRFTRRAQLVFNLQNYTDSSTLLPALANLELARGPTRTDHALQLLRQSAEDGSMGLRDGFPHIAVVVTDGASDDRESTRRQADLLHKTNIFQVYSAGIGEARLTELQTIASSPSLVFFTNEFDATAVEELERNITQQLCRRQCKLINNRTI